MKAELIGELSPRFENKWDGWIFVVVRGEVRFSDGKQYGFEYYRQSRRCQDADKRSFRTMEWVELCSDKRSWHAKGVRLKAFQKYIMRQEQ